MAQACAHVFPHLRGGTYLTSCKKISKCSCALGMGTIRGSRAGPVLDEAPGGCQIPVYRDPPSLVHAEGAEPTC